MRMPNDKYTEDADEYCDAWDAFAQPLADATGTQLVSFDPSITLSNGNFSVQLPVWFVERYNDICKNQKIGELK